MINEDTLQAVLLALAQGSDDDVERAITNSAVLDDEDRAVIRRALDSADTAPAMARALGDAIRAAGNIDYLSNECYRAAFYLGDGISDLRKDPLFGFFSTKRTGRILDKWVHYFPVYSEHLERFRGRPVRLLEIGVYRGGSLDMWRWYLGDDAVIVGVDIDERARAVSAPDHVVEIGDQTDPQFLRSLSDKYGPFDIVIDDGGHEMRQQIVTAETMFPLLADGGVLLTEDCHTSYWEGYEGGRGRKGTFIEWCKERVDDLNGYHQDRPIDRTWTDTVGSMTFYDSIVVVKKQQRFAPFAEQVGHAEFLLLSRLSAQHVTELEARRAAAVADRDAGIAEREELRQQLETERRTVAMLSARLEQPLTEKVAASVRRLRRGAASRLDDLRGGSGSAPPA